MTASSLEAPATSTVSPRELGRGSFLRDRHRRCERRPVPSSAVVVRSISWWPDHRDAVPVQRCVDRVGLGQAEAEIDVVVQDARTVLVQGRPGTARACLVVVDRDLEPDRRRALRACVPRARSPSCAPSSVVVGDSDVQHLHGSDRLSLRASFIPSRIPQAARTRPCIRKGGSYRPVPMIALPAASRRDPAAPDRVRVVESDEPGVVRRMKRQQVAEPVPGLDAHAAAVLPGARIGRLSASDSALELCRIRDDTLHEVRPLLHEHTAPFDQV